MTKPGPEQRAKYVGYLAKVFSRPGIRVVGNRIELDSRLPEPAQAMGLHVGTFKDLLDTEYDATYLAAKYAKRGAEAVKSWSESPYTGKPLDDPDFITTYYIGPDNTSTHAGYRAEWTQILQEVQASVKEQGLKADITLYERGGCLSLLDPRRWINKGKDTRAR